MKPQDVEKFSTLNTLAKNLVKRGQFRSLSVKLLEILEFLKGHNIKIVNPVPFGGRNTYSNSVITFEIELLRFRAMVYQHLDYFDALNEPENEIANFRALTGTFESENERISDEQLFENLRRIREYHPADSVTIVAEGASALEHIRKCRTLEFESGHYGDNLLRWWQELAWSVIIYCDQQFKLNNVDFADRELRVLEYWVENTLRRKGFSCDATLAMLKEHLGRVKRRLGRYDDAEKSYYESIEHYLRKSEATDGDFLDPPELNRVYLNRRAAQVFIYGLQQLHASRSDVQRSEASLLVGRLLLSGGFADELTLPYVMLCEGIIKRIRAGVDPSDLAAANQLIENSKQHFAKLRIKPLVEKCDWELLIIQHLLGNVAKANQLLEYFQTSYSTAGDTRRLANTLTLWSHRQRKKGNNALSLDYARQAYDEAKRSGNKIAIIDSLISLGESEFLVEKDQRKNHGESNQRFEAVLKMASDNKKFRAVALLGLSKIAAFRGNSLLANQLFGEYKSIENLIEHRFVTDQLALAAQTEMDTLCEGFYIPYDTKQLDFRKHSESLKEWLYRRASARHRTQVAIAKAINLSQPTLRSKKRTPNDPNV